jgi:hypothetical protein
MARPRGLASRKAVSWWATSWQPTFWAVRPPTAWPDPPARPRIAPCPAGTPAASGRGGTVDKVRPPVSAGSWNSEIPALRAFAVHNSQTVRRPRGRPPGWRLRHSSIQQARDSSRKFHPTNRDTIPRSKGIGTATAGTSGIIGKVCLVYRDNTGRNAGFLVEMIPKVAFGWYGWYGWRGWHAFSPALPG